MVPVIRSANLDGHPAEITDDWYAQDKQGNVWYFGEETATLGTATTTQVLSRPTVSNSTSALRRFDVALEGGALAATRQGGRGRPRRAVVAVSSGLEIAVWSGCGGSDQEQTQRVVARDWVPSRSVCAGSRPRAKM